MLEAQIQNRLVECGTDEAGRGCLAGPVTAAAVILPQGFTHPYLNDSKQLSKKKRDTLRLEIEEIALSWAVVHVMMEEIDKINILNASITAMQRAIAKLDPKPGFIAVDGNRFKQMEGREHRCVVKGDGKYLHIAAASVLAKTHRDQFMAKIDAQHPQYSWKQNKGYPTAAHRQAIIEYGITTYHRKSFQLLPRQFSLDI